MQIRADDSGYVRGTVQNTRRVENHEIVEEMFVKLEGFEKVQDLPTSKFTFHYFNYDEMTSRGKIYFTFSRSTQP